MFRESITEVCALFLLHIACYIFCTESYKSIGRTTSMWCLSVGCFPIFDIRAGINEAAMT